MFCDNIAEHPDFFWRKIHKMLIKHSNLFRFLFLLAVISLNVNFVFAQDKDKDDDDDSADTKSVVLDEEPRLVSVAVGDGIGSRIEDDDEKITGATVRGKVLYDDTARPARYVMIALAEDKSSVSTYSLTFVKTDENGDFVLKNVKAGTYIPYIKSDGVMNVDSFNFAIRGMAKDEIPADFFQKINVSGLGEFQVEVRAKRGGAVSGRIIYADGEAAVGVKVEVLKKNGERYDNASQIYGNQGVGTATTDDRGFYRLTSLPAGTYIVRVIEPVSHSQKISQYDYSSQYNQSTTLRTYFPEGEDPKKARELEITYGQEQTAIDVTLPDRQLFDISGMVIQKANKQPIDKANIMFYRLSESNEVTVSGGFGGNSTTSAKSGNWSLQNLPKGKYRIVVSQGYNYQSDGQNNQNKQEFSSITKEIEITDKDIPDLVFEMTAGASIEGTVTIDGGKDVPQDIRLYVANMQTGETSFSDYVTSTQNRQQNSQPSKQRNFRIGKLNEGKYRLVYMGGGKTFYVKSISGNGVSGGNELTISVKEGEKLTGVQVVLASDVGTVKGKVEGFDGSQTFVVLLKTGATIEQAQSQSFSAVVKPNGDYEVQAAPGEYSIFVISSKNRPKTQAEATDWLKTLLENASKITVRANETETMTLSMPK